MKNRRIEPENQLEVIHAEALDPLELTVWCLIHSGGLASAYFFPTMLPSGTPLR